MTLDWLRQRKIAQLPGTKRTPDVSLASSLEKAQGGRVKSVVVVMEFTDGSFDADWSAMPGNTLAMHALVLNKLAQKECFQ